MIAGAMTEWLEILRPVEQADAFGSKTVTWQAAALVRAERVRLSGRRSDEVGEHFPDYSAQWKIRRMHEVRDNWRVRQDSLLYTVTNIIPNRRRGYRTLVCERVNE